MPLPETLAVLMVVAVCVFLFAGYPVALTLGVLVLSEPLTVGLLVGFPLVLAGSALATRRVAQPASPAAAVPVHATEA